MLNLRGLPIDGSHRAEKLIWFCVSQLQSHINRRENDQFMDFFSLFLLEQDKGGKVCKKAPRVD